MIGRLLVFLDFDEIREEAAKPKNKLEYVNVVIERAPVCKSIFVGGIPENTSQKEVVKYFNKFGVVEKFVTNTEEVKAQRMKEKRAIVYFKHERSTCVIRLQSCRAKRTPPPPPQSTLMN